MNNIKLSVLAIMVLGFFSSCGGDDDVITNTPTFEINATGLEDLGADYKYEGWLIVDGSPVSAGLFTVDGSGNLSQTTFEMSEANLTNATAYVLTIEPSPDSDPAPSSTHILAGDFNGNAATLNVDHAAALGNDFTSSAGGYILATPTDGGNDTNENSGIWWLDPNAGPGAGLTLPTLPEGWAYEGWAVIDGTPISTGVFTNVSGADNNAIFSGTAGGPPFPGEDFLLNAPSGLNFPLDLAGKTAVISIEPVPDNSAAPFTLKPLVGPIPTDATDHTLYEMNNNAAATNPTGSVSR